MLTQDETLRNRYRVIRQLGQGGMGAVYEAHDNVFDTSVALKLVTINLSSAYDTKAQEMAQLAFEREAKILARVNHENIPHVKDYFTEGNGQFLVMELVDGEDLGKLLNQRKAPFPIGTIIEWTDRVLDALEYLHSQIPPVIHRDIKPQNLKLTTRQKLKLLDFGIAKGTEVQGADTIGNQTFIAATLNYSPIEQMLRVLDPTFLAVITHKYSQQIDSILDQTADVRSDLYALGATIYHLATNVPPAEAVKRAIEIWDGNPDPIIEPANLNPEIPKEISDFLLKSLQIRREYRFATAYEMRQELQKIVESTENPTLKQTVQMKSDDFQSMKTEISTGEPATYAGTASIEDGVSFQETKAFDDAVSQETISFTDRESIGGAVGKQNIADSVPQATHNSFQPNTAHNQPVDTGQNFSTSPQIVAKKSKAIWLIPIAFLLFLVVGGGAFGVWYFINSSGQRGNIPDDTNSKESVNSNTNTQKKEETSGPQGVGASADTEIEGANAQPTNTLPKPDSLPATVQTTPKPVEVVKPKTPKPPPPKTPKPKNMDCIFTDDC